MVSEVQGRREVFAKLEPLLRPDRPFVNLPEMHKGRWGDRPELMAEIEFLEWTESDHLGHSKFAGLREDKGPKSVVKGDADEI